MRAMVVLRNISGGRRWRSRTPNFAEILVKAEDYSVELWMMDDEKKRRDFIGCCIVARPAAGRVAGASQLLALTAKGLINLIKYEIRRLALNR